jgi:predicted short-subunit dehydrogenase-like oxidoreductase (DUF2520 family)
MATPQQYASAFELFGDGVAVLEDLLQRFGGAPFVVGQPDQTAYNCGAKAVVEHIVAQIDKAKRPG